MEQEPNEQEPNEATEIVGGKVETVEVSRHPRLPYPRPICLWLISSAVAPIRCVGR